jgi:flagellar FliL protein
MGAHAATPDIGLNIEGGGTGKKSSVKKLLIFVLLPILLLGGTAAGLVVTGIFNPFGGEEAAEHGHEKKAAAPDPANITFYDMPDLLVNLNGSGKRVSFLKMRVSLELADAKDQPAIQKLAPRVIDSFQVYLRELRAEDLRGSAGITRLKEELLRRVNAAVEPVKVRDVLFREMLVQ